MFTGLDAAAGKRFLKTVPIEAEVVVVGSWMEK